MQAHHNIDTYIYYPNRDFFFSRTSTITHTQPNPLDMEMANHKAREDAGSILIGPKAILLFPQRFIDVKTRLISTKEIGNSTRNIRIRMNSSTHLFRIQNWRYLLYAPFHAHISNSLKSGIPSSPFLPMLKHQSIHFIWQKRLGHSQKHWFIYVKIPTTLTTE